MKNKFIIIQIIMFFIISSLSSEEKETSYEIFATGIRVPINKIVLIKEGEKIGAFKLTYYEKDKADYEWYYPLHKGPKKIKSGKGKLKNKYWSITNRILFQLGEDEIKCGPLKVFWCSQNILSFENRSYVLMDLAPTNKNNILEINVNDSKLKWFTEVEHRKEFFLELDEL